MNRVARDDLLGRDLYVLDLATPHDLPNDMSMATPHFACLIAWDSSSASVDEIGNLAQRLLAAGAVYLLAWGPDCERVHDIVDEAVVGSGPPESTVDHVMTTWHSGEPLSDAIWFTLANSWPDEAYEQTCGSTLGIAIGRPEWALESRAAFMRPNDFIEDHASDQ